LNFESQDEPTKLFTVSATFSCHHYRASDSTGFDGAKIKLASQILHSYILNHAFSNVMNVSHHARIIEAKNGSLYIVGQEGNAIESADEMYYYSLYELKPDTKNVFMDCTGIQNYLATGILISTIYYI